MKVILFGATGMVGQGVLRECLLDPEVERVLVIGRTPTAQTSPKLTEIVRADLFDLASIESELSGYDAVFFCLGVSSAGLSEDEYRRVTFDLTLAIARVLVKASPGATFIYVSGAGTDATEKSITMWSRIKGATENALLELPFARKAMFRPGFIQPLHGIRSRTPLYRALYALMSPLYPVWRAIVPKYVTTTEHVGRAMLYAAKHGAPRPIVENEDINALAERARAHEGSAA